MASVKDEKSKELKFFEAMKKQKAKKASTAHTPENILKAKREREAAEKKTRSESLDDIAVMQRARKLRKEGVSESEISRIFKHLSGAKKKTAVRKIAGSIE